MKLLIGITLFSLLSSGCTKENNMPIAATSDTTFVNPNPVGNYTYLALGDSYTIGESVKQAESFPYQLQAILKKNGRNVRIQKL